MCVSTHADRPRAVAGTPALVVPARWKAPPSEVILEIHVRPTFKYMPSFKRQLLLMSCEFREIAAWGVAEIQMQ